MPDLLIEIGTEEIPASYLAPAVRGLCATLGAALRDARIEAPEPTLLYTPRRLALHWAGLAEKGESRTERRTGPAARIAFDAEGKPSKAALGFARSVGLDPGRLEVVETEKGKYLTAVVTDEGESASVVVGRALAAALGSVPFPKTMRWTGSPVAFARPIRNLVVLLDETIVGVQAAGVRAGRSTQGHPFLSPDRFDLPGADLASYVEALRGRFVRVDASERRECVRAGLTAFGGKRLGDGPAGLLDEVVNLTEWPVVIEGRIEEEFLDLPVEVLEVSMRVHLRFFPLRDDEGRPQARFLAVMNREPASADTVREGSERVLRARLTDARFFTAEDRRTRLEDRVESLADKALHRELGSYREKCARLVDLSRWLAAELGWEDAADSAARAAHLSKADLVTEMVGEFPELQGTMGRIYAERDGEDPEVAQAIEEHYRPRGPDDVLPRGRAALLVALAEKLDNLAAFFSIGGAPTGSSDPFGLRRQALGLLRISAERNVAVPLGRAVSRAVDLLGAEEQDVLTGSILAYLKDRLYQSATDEGYRYDLIRAALAAGFDDVPDFRMRLAALHKMAEEEWWGRLVEVVERTHNIIRGAMLTSDVNPALLSEPEESALHAALLRYEPEVLDRLAEKDYAVAARAFVDGFADVVHAFFEKVFVNVEDPAVRGNRIALLGRVNSLFAARVADLARVEKGSAG